MNYIDYFLPLASRKPTCKPRTLAMEEDWEFLCSVFPEIGFRSYFLGFIVSKLAKELKQNGITSYHERAERPEFADISRFLSNIELTGTGKENNPDDRRGVGPSCVEVKERKGDAAGDAFPAGGETKEGEDGKGKQEAGPKSTGLEDLTYETKMNSMNP